MIVSVVEASVRLSVPLMLAALGGMFSERAGIVDFSLEGKLLAGAFAAAVAALEFGSPYAGIAAGAVAGMLIALLHGYAVNVERGDHTISCVGINFMVIGATATIALAAYGLGGQTPLMDASHQIPSLGEVLGIGRSQSLLGRLLALSLIVYAALFLVGLSATLFATRYGLYITASGENPNALEAAGVSVLLVRFLSLAVGGAICGIGGAYLSIGQNAQFVPLMSAGKGYMALAVLIFAKWRPVPILFISLGFGFLDAMEARLQGVPLPYIGIMPVQLVQALPYLVSIVVLAGAIGSARPPAALGRPYRR